ncbi:MAG: ABC transporter permease [bacterium]|nr:ABC transporter permease [bacterium]
MPLIGFDTVASPLGLLIGVVCGLVPLYMGIRLGQVRVGIGGLVACVLSGFACGFIGGLPMILLTVALVASYARPVNDDPYMSRATLEQVNFSETRGEAIMRSLAGMGRSLRLAARAVLRNRAGFIGFLGVAFFFGMTTFGPLFIEYDGQAHFYDRLQPGAQTLFQGPSAEFPLGLDYQGRDILSHIVYGGQGVIFTAALAGVLTTFIAVTFGAAAALLGGVVDTVLTAIANFILTIPQFPLLVVIAAVINLDERVYLALLLAALDWPSLMRAIRAQVLSLRERDYVEAAVSLNLGLGHIIGREVMPNMISYIVISTIFSIRAAMYQQVGLVFLGLVPLQEPDWGVMILLARQQGALFLQEATSMLLSPVLAIALFQLSLVLFTRSLEEIFNPRLREGL